MMLDLMILFYLFILSAIPSSKTVEWYCPTCKCHHSLGYWSEYRFTQVYWCKIS